MAGILSGLLGLFGLGGCVKDKEKDHLLDGPDMYYTPGKPAPYANTSDGKTILEKQIE